jgi:hypothetical protein
LTQDLEKEWGSNLPATMDWNRHTPAIGMYPTDFLLFDEVRIPVTGPPAEILAP